MKKRNLIILIIICSPLTLFVFGRLLGFLLLFTIKTGSSYPNLQPHDAVLASSLMTAQNGDFIFYDQIVRPEYGKSIWVHRMIANEGDILEIRQGICYVNGRSSDGKLDLVFPYITSVINQSFIEKHFPFLNKDVGINDTNMTVYLSNSEVKGLPKDIKVERYFKKKGDIVNLQTPLFGDSQNEFNIDNFGPMKIPKDSCFVIGDNRHQSDDSRYWGFVAKSNIKGVFVMKIGLLSWIYRKLGI